VRRLKEMAGRLKSEIRGMPHTRPRAPPHNLRDGTCHRGLKWKQPPRQAFAEAVFTGYSTVT
jgi:hypothetical protein